MNPRAHTAVYTVFYVDSSYELYAFQELLLIDASVVKSALILFARWPSCKIFAVVLAPHVHVSAGNGLEYVTACNHYDRLYDVCTIVAGQSQPDERTTRMFCVELLTLYLTYPTFPLTSARHGVYHYDTQSTSLCVVGLQGCM